MHIRYMPAILATMASTAALAGPSQISLYGRVDLGVHYDSINSGTAIMSPTLSASRFGLRGTEDLDNGLTAGFQLESGFSAADGHTYGFSSGRLFDRFAKVGLEGSFGSIYLGRQKGPFGNAYGLYDLLSVTGSSPTDILPLRMDNSVYYSNKWKIGEGEITTDLAYALGDTPGHFSVDSQKELGLSYHQKNLDLAIAVNRSTGISAPPPDSGKYSNFDEKTLNADHFTVGGSYVIGPIQVVLGYAFKQNDPSNTLAMPLGKYKHHMFFNNIVYTITPAFSTTLSYYRHQLNAENTSSTSAPRDGKADLFALLADYKFSQRTDVYVEYDYSRTGKGDGLQTMYANEAEHKRSGLSIGIRHRF